MKARNFVAGLAVAVVVLSAAAPVAGAAYTSAEPEQIVTRAELTEWRYRVYNGRPQKRLWSITENKWLTDWMYY